MKKDFKWVAAVNIVLLAAIVLAACPGFAQNDSADSMQIVLKKIRDDKKLLVAENMQLTPAEAKSFWPVYERYQDELFLIRARTAKMITEYRDSFGKMTNKIARKLLDEYMEIDLLRLKLHQAYLVKFRKVLPEVKVARYYQIENKIQVALMYELAKNIPLVQINN